MLVILYRSGLGVERVAELFRERAEKYQEVPGLLQKLYVHDPSTNEVGGIYVFDGAESVERFRASDLEKSIRTTYRLAGPPLVREFEVVHALRDI